MNAMTVVACAGRQAVSINFLAQKSSYHSQSTTFGALFSVEAATP